MSARISSTVCSAHCCVSLIMGPHICPATENAKGDGAVGGGDAAGPMESECPVCKDFLFFSDTPEVSAVRPFHAYLVFPGIHQALLHLPTVP